MMELAIYACGSDAVLFVPALYRPPSEAEAMFGPLEFIGQLSIGDAQMQAWQDILLQIERHLFATVPTAHALLLMEAVERKTMACDTDDA